MNNIIARCDPNAENPKEVLIDPPNIKTNNVKKGAAIDKVLFSKPGYNAVGEPYKPSTFSLVRKEDRAYQITQGNEKPFRPQSEVKKRLYTASYAHMTDFVEIKKNYLDPENPRNVLINPPNIRTNPIKKGQSGRQVTFGGKIPYMEDDYNRPKYFAATEREVSASKMQDKPFS